MTEFFQNARYKTAADAVDLDGTVILASGIPLHTLERRRRALAKEAHLKRRLLDPQVYLSGLSVATGGKACATLASYGWFDAVAPLYDSSKQKQHEWREPAIAEVAKSWTGHAPTDPRVIEDRVRSCITVQWRLGCEAFILPSPLRTDPSTDLSTELAWLDAGLEIAKRIAPDVPRLATIAISDTCLVNVDPWSSHMLDTLLDQVSAREPEGAYVVIEQASHQRLYEAHSNTLGSLARLVRDLRAAGVPRVVVPLAGVAGLLAATLGAQTWSSGWYRGQRRVRVLDLETQEQGRAYPTYYSHPLAGEIHLGTDLDAINRAGLLNSIADETSWSNGLLQALRRHGGVVASVPEWEYRKTNVKSARGHFAEALRRETLALSQLSMGDRLDAAKRWLDGATKNAAKISSLGGDFHYRTELGHQPAWRAVLDAASSS
jgi:hypothetical protein